MWTFGFMCGILFSLIIAIALYTLWDVYNEERKSNEWWRGRECPKCEARDNCLFVNGYGRCNECGFYNEAEAPWVAKVSDYCFICSMCGPAGCRPDCYLCWPDGPWSKIGGVGEYVNYTDRKYRSPIPPPAPCNGDYHGEICECD